MTSYLIDTNIILRFCNRDDVQHQTALEAIKHLIQQNDSCFVTSQVLIEFWVVATRPISVNGLGWDVQFTVKMLKKILTQFEILEDSPTVFQNWLNLIERYQVTGKRSHDIRLVATMQTHGVSHLLTLNPRDFSMITEISIVHPLDLRVQ